MQIQRDRSNHMTGHVVVQLDCHSVRPVWPPLVSNSRFSPGRLLGTGSKTDATLGSKWSNFVNPMNILLKIRRCSDLSHGRRSMILKRSYLHGYEDVKLAFQLGL